MNIFSKCYDFVDAEFLTQTGFYSFYRQCQGFDGSNMIYGGKSIIMTASNNYLGLATDPRVIEASSAASKKYGTSCTGSRLLNGNLDLHAELEGELASFLGKQSALVLSTGFLANQAAIEAIAGPADTILSDSENHASIISGCSLSKAEVLRYEHNDMKDLEHKLEPVREEKPCIIISDGVFSMGGDIVDLPAMLAAAKGKQNKKVPIMIDDAHGLGVIGHGGRGTASHFDLNDEVDLIVGTFSKSLASVGGFIAGDSETINFIRHKARSMIFTAGLPAGQVAAALEALRIMQAEPERISNLRRNAVKVRVAFKEMGLNTLHSETPIIPVLVGNEGLTCKIAKELFDLGIFATPVIYPAVPFGSGIIRTSFMATHTPAQIEQVIQVFADIAKRHELGTLRPRHDHLITRRIRETFSKSRPKNYSWSEGGTPRDILLAGTKALIKRKIIKLAHSI